MTLRFSVILLLFLSTQAQAQGPPPGPEPAQLPLSGRGGQGGSVNTVQTPVPGVTSKRA